MDADYFEIVLHGPDGTTLAAHNTGSNLSFSAAAEVSGLYHAAVHAGRYYDSQHYGLNITSKTQEDFFLETENNDKFSSADLVTAGNSISGQLSAANDWDIFSINVTSAGILSAEFDGLTDSTYSDYFILGLYDVDGNILAEKHSGKDFLSVLALNRQGRITRLLPPVLITAIVNIV